jgi:toxin ParE1/3/4
LAWKTHYYTDVASAELAFAFVDEVQAVYRFIASNPELGSRRFSHFLPGNALRFWLCDRFPFVVFYTFNATEVQVRRVLHGRQNITTRLFH